MKDILEKAANIKLVIFDVDGVLTDGGIYIDHQGNEHKVFNSRDGHGMKMLQQCGIKIAIITGRTSKSVSHRMEGLGIKYVYQGQDQKLGAYTGLIKELEINQNEVAYVGDDVVDLPIMCRVGLAIAVSDAHELVKKHAHWQTSCAGGHGAARDVCELVMEAQGFLEPKMMEYISG